jgi:hypothetical protein
MKVKTNVRGGAMNVNGDGGGGYDDYYPPRSLVCPRRYP